MRGLPLTASSKTLDGSSGIFPVNIAAGDSTVWARLKAAGMPLLGHTQMSEFAFSTGTPQTGNPWDTTKSPGGSSGGSAAALAARMTPAATGSDTGGSLRLPSSACGTTTIKATYGLISTYGVLPLEWSYDNAGPMARSVADVALLLSYLAGADDHDAATLAGRPPAFYPTSPTPAPKPLSGKRIGIPNSPSDGSLSAGILAVLTRVKGELAALGASLVPVTSPVDPTTTTAGMALVAEVKTFHSQLYPARAAYYTPFVAEILALYEGENPLAIDYVAAGRFRAQYMAAWNHVFADGTLDAVLQPTQTADTPTRSSTGELTIVTASGTSGPQKMWDSIGFPVVALRRGCHRPRSCRWASSSWRSRTRRSRCCRSRSTTRLRTCTTCSCRRPTGERRPDRRGRQGAGDPADGRSRHHRRRPDRPGGWRPRAAAHDRRHRPHAVAGRPDVVVRCWLDQLRWPAGEPAGGACRVAAPRGRGCARRGGARAAPTEGQGRRGVRRARVSPEAGSRGGGRSHRNLAPRRHRSARARLRPRAAGRQPGRGAGDQEPPGRDHRRWSAQPCAPVARHVLQDVRTVAGAHRSVANRCRRAPQQASVVLPSGLARGRPAPRRGCPQR